MTPIPGGDNPNTRDPAYTHRLLNKSGAGWRARLDVQRPYRWNLRRLGPGRCLDVGCGVGRNLAHLPPGSVGVDHNPTSVEICRTRGLGAFTSDEFPELADVGTFESLLFAHVLEHLDESSARELLMRFLPYLCNGGQVIVITPQERGFASDDTHVRWVGFDEVQELFSHLNVTLVKRYSFPFPRLVGRFFYANEFVIVGQTSSPL